MRPKAITVVRGDHRTQYYYYYHYYIILLRIPIIIM